MEIKMSDRTGDSSDSNDSYPHYFFGNLIYIPKYSILFRPHPDNIYSEPNWKEIDYWFTHYNDNDMYNDFQSSSFMDFNEFVKMSFRCERNARAIFDEKHSTNYDIDLCLSFKNLYELQHSYHDYQNNPEHQCIRNIDYSIDELISFVKNNDIMAYLVAIGSKSIKTYLKIMDIIKNDIDGCGSFYFGYLLQNPDFLLQIDEDQFNILLSVAKSTFFVLERFLMMNFYVTK